MSEDGFLKRWSDRKRAEASDAAPEPPGPACEPAEPPPLSEDELAELTPLEAMTAETDLGQFLRRGVPAALQRAALRRMWALNPKIRDYVDDARDYAWDWNAPGKVPGAGPVDPERALRAVARILREAPPPKPPLDRVQEEAAPPEEPAAAAAPPLPPQAEPEGPPRGRRHGGATPSLRGADES